MTHRYKLLALDIDGVLTDGKLHYGPSGEETKVFHVKDGAAIKELMSRGVEVCWITARGADSVKIRAKELGVKRLHMGVKDKLSVLKKIIKEMKISLEQVCYAGDHLMDLPCMEKVGLAFSPADAIAKVRDKAHIATKAKGGEGVVDEIATILLDTNKKKQDFHIVIPARFASQRLPGKPLIKLAGKTMIEWVYLKAKATKAANVIIATDDDKILKTC